MVKKIIGGIFSIFGVITLISLISFLLKDDTGVVGFETIIAELIPIFLYVLSGIFLFRYDRVKKMDYAQGLKLRKKQNIIVIVFAAAYLVLFFASIHTALESYKRQMDYLSMTYSYSYYYPGSYSSLADEISNDFIHKMIISFVRYVIPGSILGYLLDLYAMPYWGCKKIFKTDEAILNVVLSEENKFYAISEDKSVFTNGEAVFFPEMFCVIPFDQIESMKELNLLVIKEVIFKLNNGKKITVITKAYQNILNAVNATKVSK